MLSTVFEQLRSKGLERGSIVISMAGHDRGRLYLVTTIEPPYVWLTDGRYRPLDRTKKKRIKHLRLLGHPQPVGVMDMIEQLPEAGRQNAAIRNHISEFMNSHQNPDKEEN